MEAPRTFHSIRQQLKEGLKYLQRWLKRSLCLLPQNFLWLSQIILQLSEVRHQHLHFLRLQKHHLRTPYVYILIFELTIFKGYCTNIDVGFLWRASRTIKWDYRRNSCWGGCRLCCDRCHSGIFVHPCEAIANSPSKSSFGDGPSPRERVTEMEHGCRGIFQICMILGNIVYHVV